MRENAEFTPETGAALVVAIVFWVAFFWWIGRNNRRFPNRPASVPVALIPVGYLLLQINPLIDYLLYRMNLRRSQRIRAFLQLADDLWMRKKSINRRFPGFTGR